MVSNTVIMDILALFNSFQGFTQNLINIISNIITAGFELSGGLIRFPQGPERDAFTSVSRTCFLPCAHFLHTPIDVDGADFTSNDCFDEQWSHLAQSLAAYEKRITAAFSNKIESILEKGISQDDGIYGALLNGTYIKPEPPIFLPILADNLKNVTTVISLVQILRSMVSEALKLSVSR